jgi:hypothetical protein
MKVCLANFADMKWLGDDLYKCPYMLESFFYCKDWELPFIKNADFFLLDSGAFTFMSSKKNKEINFNDYLTRYIEFINKNDIKYFFELDIDSVVGLKEVERLRARLEKETNKQCIPVWHKSRGKDYFIEMCKNYDYVSIGGIVSKEIKPEEYKYLKWFIDTAHSYGCKIHGLGFTSVKELPIYNFDSVDSTSWKSGGRFGAIHLFNGHELKDKADENKKRVHHTILTRHNYFEWLKYQKFADLYL